jgi:hypothetical protein
MARSLNTKVATITSKGCEQMGTAFICQNRPLNKAVTGHVDSRYVKMSIKPTIRLSLWFFPSQLKLRDITHELSFLRREITIATRVDSPLESIWRHLAGHSNCILHFSAGRRKLFRNMCGPVIARRGGRSTDWVERSSRHRGRDAGAPCARARGALRSGSSRRFHRGVVAGLGDRTWWGRVVAVVRV